MQGFFDFVKSMGAPRLAAMGAVTLALIGFFVTHLLLVLTTGVFNHLRSMITGWYTLQQTNCSVVTEQFAFRLPDTKGAPPPVGGAEARPEHRLT